MTREEAIQILKGERWYMSRYSVKYKEAYDMAIEALSAPSGDLISRAEAKQAIRDRFPNLADRLEINNVLNNVPSADAVHKPDYSYEADMVRRLKESLSADADWIPCSERLPKEKQEVYVTVYFIEGDTGRAYGYMDGFGSGIFLVLLKEH